MRLEFAEGRLDRVEVWGIRRKVNQLRARRFDRLPDASHLVGWKIVYHDDVAALDDRDNALLHINKKHRPVDGAPATNVITFQCPCGAYPISRLPRGQRPRSRTMLVLVQVSLMNISRAGSNMPCCRCQRRRSRAICSVAYKVFFIADVPSLEEPPHRAAA